MKVSDILNKINDSFEVSILANGYVLDIRGRDKQDDWSSCKLAVATVEELFEVIKEIAEMPVDK